MASTYIWVQDRASSVLSIATAALEYTSRSVLPTSVPDMFFGKQTFNPDTDIPDLKGKTIIVTGGNTGLGKVSALEFVKHGAKVYMASRTESKARSAIEDIKSKAPSAQLEYLKLDLASLESVKHAADEFNGKESQLHILLNNAGVMAMPAEQTKDGFDIQWGTNHMGHALLTKLLLPTILKTAETEPKGTVRIVNLSSEGHRWTKAGISFDDLALANDTAFSRYGQAKLANLLHAKALAKRYGDNGIIAVSLHPGVIWTDLWNPFTGSLGFLGKLVEWPSKLLFTDVVTGSRNQIAACVSPAVTLEDNGTYYVPVLVKKAPSSYGQDESLADKLWEHTESVLRGKGY